MCGRFIFNQCRLTLLPCVFGFGDYGLRLVLLPLVVMADVIAYIYYGWCYCHVVDVRPLGCFLLQFEFWDVIQNLIPYMRQMVLAYISIEGWIIHPDVNSFFYGSDEVLVLPPYNAEIFNSGVMTCDVMVVIYGEGTF